MSRREIRACDHVGSTGQCNREASGSCPLCEKDFCPTHVSAELVEVRVGVKTTGQTAADSRGGWTSVQPCQFCMAAITRLLASGYKLQAILPNSAQLIEALRALLAAEMMKSKVADAG